MKLIDFPGQLGSISSEIFFNACDTKIKGITGKVEAIFGETFF